MKLSQRVACAGLCVLPLLLPPLHANEPLSSLDFRYRLELVDQEDIDKEALASTASLKVGLRSAPLNGFDAGMMLQASRVLGDRRFNDTVRPSERPVVADPSDTAISQAWVRYRQGEQFQGIVGRQRLIDDNARFIGNVGFRQLEQTFDALSLNWQPASDWQLDIQYLDRAHRIFGPNHPNPLMAEADLDSWVAIGQRRWGETRLDVYAHRFRFEDRPASHENVGFRLRGPISEQFSYRLEIARQSGLDGEGPVSDQDYLRLELHQSLAEWRWFVGHERLGGDGESAFQTPFATLHAHNGWADQFLATPAVGLRDTWLGASRGFGPWEMTARVHDFQADSGGMDLGQELNVSLGRALGEGWQTQVKLAWFDGDQGPVDVSKLWWTVSASL